MEIGIEVKINSVGISINIFYGLDFGNEINI